jgi:hypothetical protein
MMKLYLHSSVCLHGMVLSIWEGHGRLAVRAPCGSAGNSDVGSHIMCDNVYNYMRRVMYGFHVFMKSVRSSCFYRYTLIRTDKAVNSLKRNIASCIFLP